MWIYEGTYIIVIVSIITILCYMLHVIFITINIIKITGEIKGSD